MFEVFVFFKNGEWIDLQGVPDTILAKALKDWSNGSETVMMKTFSFQSDIIKEIRVIR